MQIQELLAKLTPDYVKSIGDKNEDMGHVLDMLECEFNNGGYVDYIDNSWSNAKNSFLVIDVHTWWCTDSIVGIKAIYAKFNFNRDWDLVAITYQSGRKYDVNINWVSDFKYAKTKAIWESYVAEDSVSPKLFNPLDEIPEFYLEKHGAMYKTVL